jgi:hypothetical protein
MILRYSIGLQSSDIPEVFNPQIFQTSSILRYSRGLHSSDIPVDACLWLVFVTFMESSDILNDFHVVLGNSRIM